MGIIIKSLKEELFTNSLKYPVFISFISSEDILKIAEVPSFQRNTSNHRIADNVLTPPIKEWQRPLDDFRVLKISDVFSSIGNIMPNPVLLCQNIVSNIPTINIRQLLSNTGGIPTGIWEIEISEPNVGQDYPLWILDGQHRINGLASSSQKRNKIPTVLLLDHETMVYNAPFMAKIFAQVTTEAEPLDELHNEWLTFAFELSHYNPQIGSNVQDKRKSMAVVSELCRNHSFGTTTNPFFNQIKFNKSQNVSLPNGGFSYTCKELADIIFKKYYNSSSSLPKISPIELAEEISKAYIALSTVILAPQDKSVFFGIDDHGQKIMQDAYLVGIFSYILHNGRPSASSLTWENILRSLNFHQTDWNFKSWVRTLSGPANSKSKRIAIKVFSEVFSNVSLPSNTSNLSDYFKGNQAKVTIDFSPLTPSGKKSRTNILRETLSRGDVKSSHIQPRKHIKLIEATSNIADVIISDKQSPPGRLVTYNLKSGMILNSNDHSNPLRLLISMFHYGGTESNAEFDITF